MQSVIKAEIVKEIYVIVPDQDAWKEYRKAYHPDAVVLGTFRFLEGNLMYQGVSLDDAADKLEGVHCWQVVSYGVNAYNIVALKTAIEFAVMYSKCIQRYIKLP